MFQVRTDLALETKEKFEEDNVELKGVRIHEEERGENIKITEVIIETENGAKSMGKPRGSYITIEAQEMTDGDDGYHREISEELAKVLRGMIPVNREELSVLVVGLGNREITPDALGPRVADNMMITRHVIREFGKYALGAEHSNLISSIVPGVMAQTGMESLEIIRGVIRETEPDCIVAVDALAARSVKRLNRTIQITNTGINPGSGVGNHRHGRESVGIPVIAIGVPTVVDAATIVNDAISGYYEEVDCTLNSFFVTPKDIDESIKRLSFTISEGLNLAFEKTACTNS